MCFADFVQFLGVMKDVAVTLAATTGIYVALAGLNSWKKQKKWEENRHLAKSILLKLYLLRTAIGEVRSPGIYSEEVSNALKEEDKELAGAELENLKVKRVYKSRWEKVNTVQAELHPLLLEAEVIWGNELSNLLQALSAHVAKLALAIRVMLIVEHSPRKKVSQYLIDKNNANLDIIYGDLRPEDDYNDKLEEILAKIDNYLKKYLGRKS